VYFGFLGESMANPFGNSKKVCTKSSCSVYNSIKGLKESDFSEKINKEDNDNIFDELYSKNDKKQLNKELSEMVEQVYFSRLERENNLEQLSYFVINEKGQIPSYFRVNDKNYKKVERFVEQIIVNQGLIEYQNLIEGNYEFAEDVEHKPALAFILNEDVLDKKEIDKINFKDKLYKKNHKSFVSKYLIQNFQDKICEFMEEPGSFTLNEDMIPKEFYR
jgi:hypothetical protein